MSLLDGLIAQGLKNNAEFTQELIKIKAKVANTPERQAIADLQSTTAAMQDIDEYALEQQANTQTDTEAMKDIDDFTLTQMATLDERLTDVEIKVNGGDE